MMDHWSPYQQGPRARRVSISSKLTRMAALAIWYTRGVPSGVSQKNCGMRMRVTIGCNPEAQKTRSESTSYFEKLSPGAGSSFAPGKESDNQVRIATFSLSGRPPMISVGTLPLAFSARYSEERCSCSANLTTSSRYGQPICSSAINGTREQESGAKYSVNSLIDPSLACPAVSRHLPLRSFVAFLHREAG